MRLGVLSFVVLLAGCQQINSTLHPDSDAAKQYAAERRFNSCMNQTLGHFGSFQSPEARLKAADVCKSVSASPASQPAS